jgi:hypothetical protein
LKVPLTIPKTEPYSHNVLAWLFVVLQELVKENIALCAMLELRGVTRKKLQKELASMLEKPKIKRRARAEFDPVQQEILEALQHISTQRILERAPVSGKPH